MRGNFRIMLNNESSVSGNVQVRVSQGGRTVQPYWLNMHAGWHQLNVATVRGETVLVRDGDYEREVDLSRAVSIEQVWP